MPPPKVSQEGYSKNNPQINNTNESTTKNDLMEGLRVKINN